MANIKITNPEFIKKLIEQGREQAREYIYELAGLSKDCGAPFDMVCEMASDAASIVYRKTNKLGGLYAKLARQQDELILLPPDDKEGFDKLEKAIEDTKKQIAKKEASLCKKQSALSLNRDNQKLKDDVRNLHKALHGADFAYPFIKELSNKEFLMRMFETDALICASNIYVTEYAKGVKKSFKGEDHEYVKYTYKGVQYFPNFESADAFGEEDFNNLYDLSKKLGADGDQNMLKISALILAESIPTAKHLASIGATCYGEKQRFNLKHQNLPGNRGEVGKLSNVQYKEMFGRDRHYMYCGDHDKEFYALTRIDRIKFMLSRDLVAWCIENISGFDTHDLEPLGEKICDKQIYDLEDLLEIIHSMYGEKLGRTSGGYTKYYGPSDLAYYLCTTYGDLQRVSIWDEVDKNSAEEVALFYHVVGADEYSYATVTPSWNNVARDYILYELDGSKNCRGFWEARKNVDNTLKKYGN